MGGRVWEPAGDGVTDKETDTVYGGRIVMAPKWVGRGEGSQEEVGGLLASMRSEKPKG